MSANTPPSGGPATLSGRTEEPTREELLRFLDRETAIARATDGRLAVLVLELRRVDRLQALLKGPAASTTMELVLDRVRKVLRSDDRAAAINDDEVCLVLPRLAHPTQATLAAVKVLRTLDRPIAHEGGSAVLRPCVGIATVPEHGYDPAELLMAADVARRIAATREEGYHVVQAEDTIESEVYRGLDLDLERAIRANELHIAYLPQIDLRTGKPVAAEAIVRWRHGAAGDIPAETIVGIAERTGLIGSLTFWALNAVLRHAAAMHRENLSPRFSVNLSTRTLTDVELPTVVDQALKTWGLPSNTVTLEITESSMIADAERSMAMLTRLKGVGVGLSIDDFGTGYSSLAYLRKFPLDELKIDKVFVAGMLSDKGDLQVVRSVIDLAHNFELRAVAEGVEDARTLEELKRMGCDVAQGFHVAAAMGEKAFRDWWAARIG
ncbi:putative bifunctional diguanylate cyclase/phosphodiesterase [Usitatibacter palustris]|uniref:Phytochrome-like protein cph2 n=1 Tax=Usitatibacter palustris TaxID=2732487 RepID=A0A6M4H9F1_9PROT|nr:GGDEF domain-containing phosphodiesterase [Usitatibacter palustris]QJR15024.1 Phytochrome-like protein cph2 [Usitatibacter palustris]